MVEFDIFNSHDIALIPMPGSSKTFSADFRGILMYECNQIICCVAFF